jgi:hypothetical protein
VRLDWNREIARFSQHHWQDDLDAFCRTVIIFSLYNMPETQSEGLKAILLESQAENAFAVCNVVNISSPRLD